MTKTRHTIIAATLLACALTIAGRAQTSAPVKDDLFAGTEVFAKGASDVTEITMDPDTLGMVAGKDRARAHTMVLNVVRTYSYDKPGMYRIEDVEVFRNKLNSGDWHCSVHTRSLKSGESTDVCNKRRSDDLSETAIITVEPKSLTFIHTIRKRGPGESDLTGMPMWMGLHGLPSLAMLDPEVFLDLKLDHLSTLDGAMLDSGALRFQLDKAMRAMPKIKLDGKQMQQPMDKAMKQMQDAGKGPDSMPQPAAPPR
jgi:hypothetical protein